MTEWRSRAGRRLLRGQRRLAARAGERRAFVVTLAVGGAAALAATWATTALYDAVADADGIARIDVPMLRAGQRLRSPAMEALCAAAARVFGPVGLSALTAVAAAGLAAAQRSRDPAVLVSASGLGSLAMAVGGKRVVHRHRPARRDARPPYEYSPSFPSGHALTTTAITGTVAYLLVLEQRSDGAQVATVVSAGALAAGVGLSRVVLGAHWFTDVVTGWVLGSGWLCVVVTAHRLLVTLRDDADAAEGDAWVA